jgi:hypothetical protein
MYQGPNPPATASEFRDYMHIIEFRYDVHSAALVCNARKIWHNDCLVGYRMPDGSCFTTDIAGSFVQLK